MANNRFSQIAQNMMDTRVEDIEEKLEENLVKQEKSEISKPDDIEEKKTLIVKKTARDKEPSAEIPTAKKTTTLPLVLALAVKELKDRRNLHSKLNNGKKITEDDVIVEALELFFRQNGENKTCFDAANEKLSFNS